MNLYRYRWLPIVLLLWLPGLRAGGLEVSDPWIRAAPPTARVLAGYLRLHNPDATRHRIVAAHSESFDKVEMHRSVIEDGMARMLPQSELVIPAGGTLVLEPGGYHLMLIGPAAPLRVDDEVEIILTDAEGKELAVTAQVREPGDDAAAEPMHHH